ncbi:glycosyltransferase family 2 protein [Rhodococcus qingshengii]|uniref:glycosyltransferase family 2 protein n=1 Tax=Rhodococcus qingshengii TaxID=334542 RepID=UPI0039C3EE01
MPRILVTVPVYGQIEYTHALVPDLIAQQYDADFVIIDNRGDYEPLGDERVIRPGRNLGWASGSNLGLRTAFGEGYTHAMTLNNDTRISKDFFKGLLDPRLPDDLGVVIPMYDDEMAHASALSDYRGPAADYVPVPRFRKAPSVDGTALMITREAWMAAGELDSRSFGKFSWGADQDLCFRVRETGFGVYISEMSFINHFGRKTALATRSWRSYKWQSAVPWFKGMRKVHGKDWPKEKMFEPTLHDLDTHALI